MLTVLRCVMQTVAHQAMDAAGTGAQRCRALDALAPLVPFLEPQHLKGLLEALCALSDSGDVHVTAIGLEEAVGMDPGHAAFIARAPGVLCRARFGAGARAWTLRRIAGGCRVPRRGDADPYDDEHFSVAVRSVVLARTLCYAGAPLGGDDIESLVRIYDDTPSLGGEPWWLVCGVDTKVRRRPARSSAVPRRPVAPRPEDGGPRPLAPARARSPAPARTSAT